MAARSVTILTFSMSIAMFTSHFHCFATQSWIKAGYWYAGSESLMSDINSSLFTHLICSFADVNSSTFEIFIGPDFKENCSNFTSTVRLKNPSVVTVMSIWNGYASIYRPRLGENVGSSVFSSMIEEVSHRKKFIESSIRTARLFGFQGIDLLWYWPSKADLLSLGTLLDEFRAAIASEKRNQGVSELILTMGVRYSPYIEDVSYPIDSLRKNLDWAHVVAFDYLTPGYENFTGNHAALYNPLSSKTTDFGITQWLSRGLPANKLVLGLPYHGYAWSLVNPRDHSLGAPAAGAAITRYGSLGYKSIKAFIQAYGGGAKPMYNSTYVVNYFVVGSSWINYDDVETIKAKVSYAKDKGLIGYSAFQVANDDNWALSLAAQDMLAERKKRRLLLEILLPFAAVSVVSVVMIFYYRHRVSNRNVAVHSLEGEQSNSTTQGLGKNAPTPQVFSFAVIKAATDNFSSKNLLGKGGYGPVYKGKLRRGQEIAIKRLALSSTQGYEEFKNEVSLTAGLQHVNLVRVIGFCTDKEEKMLVYEYMLNRSLNLYLFDPIRRRLLDWTKRVRIIEGITQGLLYLQEYSNFTVIHRDLKASNILLDADMNPKIADFGMAKLFGKDVNEANTDRIVGTYGYIPPEYAKQGIYSMKYDVYSFGVLLLQMISSKRNTCFYGAQENLNLLEYAYVLWKDGKGIEFFDPVLDDSSSDCKLITCMKVALLCVQENPDDRPTMLEVFSVLKNGAMVFSTPKRPAFSVQTENLEGPHQEACSVYGSQVSELEPR